MSADALFRAADIDWQRIGANLDRAGYAVIGGLLSLGDATASRIRFEISRSGNVWVLKDLFPEGGRHSGLRDCNPPPGERGDVFATSEKLLVTVRVPRAMAVETLVRAGTVIDQRKQAD